MNKELIKARCEWHKFESRCPEIFKNITPEGIVALHRQVWNEVYEKDCYKHDTSLIQYLNKKGLFLTANCFACQLAIFSIIKSAIPAL